MMIHRTHLSVRLGDNLQHLHFLRALAKTHPDRRFIHYAHLQYIPQLAELVCDLPNLQVCDLESVAEPGQPYWSMAPRPLLGSIDAWKNAGGFWDRHPHKIDYAAFYVHFFHHLARLMGLPSSPILFPHELVFDYPALAAANAQPFACLVVNSPPQSGQMPAFHPAQMELLVGELAAKMSVVTTARTQHCSCTADRGLTVTQIGILSRSCRYIVMVSTGPSWPTFNVFNRDTVEFRLILIGQERVNLAPNTEHVASVAEARRVLQLRGIL